MKNITLTILTILILSLTACGGASNATDPTSVNQSGSATGALPAATQLIIGTFKLEETGQAVTAEQAAELLPLWQTLQVLTDSDTAAGQESEALITQIQETMTAAQMQAITGMNLTREDMFAIMQERGLAMGGENSSPQRNSSGNGGGGFQPGGSGMPVPPDEQRGPGAGFGGGQGSGLSPDQIATAQASRQAGSGTLIPPVLINALIEHLQEKAGS